MAKNEIKFYENKGIRSAWDEEKEEWYFSIVDVVGVLTESSNPRRYWSDLKHKIKDEEGGVQLYENSVQLKLKDGLKCQLSTSCRQLKALILFYKLKLQKNRKILCKKFDRLEFL